MRTIMLEKVQSHELKCSLNRRLIYVVNYTNLIFSYSEENLGYKYKNFGMYTNYVFTFFIFSRTIFNIY